MSNSSNHDEMLRLRASPIQQRYLVQVHGNEFALPHLVALFPDSDPRVIGERRDFALEWSGWTTGLTLSAIVEKGDRLLARIRGAARICGLTTGPLNVWYVLLLDDEGRVAHQLYPFQRFYLDSHSNPEERRRIVAQAISISESDWQVARMLETLGEENDWASIRKSIEIIGARADGRKGELSTVAELASYDIGKVRRLFGAASEGLHGYDGSRKEKANPLPLHQAEMELRLIVKQWLNYKSGYSPD